jgi:dipeptidyl aminopeptidase/acylaminoacyl peptidase
VTDSPTATTQATAPHGAWPSPISAHRLTEIAPGVREPGSDGHNLLWVEVRPQERGRYVLMMLTPEGPKDVTPEPFSVRNRVHEYGGASWVAAGDTIIFSNFSDNRLYRVDGAGSEPRPITPESSFRYADLQIDVAHNRLYAIREDHTRQDREPENTMVVLDLDGPNEGGGSIVASGTDFISSPRLTEDGDRIAWITWNHPSMPWDETVLWSATITQDGGIQDAKAVAGGPKESVILHNWDNRGRLIFVSDRTGWWNLYRADLGGEATALTHAEVEYGVPLWQFGASTWTELANGTIVTAFTHDGQWYLSTIDPETLEIVQLDHTFATLTDVQPHPNGSSIIFRGGTQMEPPRLYQLDPKTGSMAPLTEHSDEPLDPGYVSMAQAISWETPDGATAYGFYYPPTNKDVAAPAGELPPLIVESHGGPTSATTSTFSMGTQFWTSRGFAILDVNYGGSTGYGREYRERLNDSWGVVDVDDCVSGALWLAEQGLADKDRLIIRGGSAGGFTTLAALAFRDVFAAGASYYGIGDLEAMIVDTHKFESKYLFGLVGPYPEAIDLIRERSAIHYIDQLSSPMILFQGLDDKVVPPNQSVMMADAVRAKGLPVALLTFEGEGHGFRMAETIEATLEAELSFYGQVFGFEPAGDIRRLKVDNLDS